MVAGDIRYRLRSFYENPKYCDITVSVGEGRQVREFYASKAVLAAWSKPLSSLIAGGFREDGRRVVNLSSVNADAFELVLRYMHEIDIQLTVDSAWQVFQVADLLCIGALVEDCIDFILQHVNEATALYWLQKSSLFPSLGRLNQAAVQLLSNRAFIKSREFLNLPISDMKTILRSDSFRVEEDTILEAVLSYCVYNARRLMEELPVCQTPDRPKTKDDQQIITDLRPPALAAVCQPCTTVEASSWSVPEGSPSDDGSSPATASQAAFLAASVGAPFEVLERTFEAAVPYFGIDISSRPRSRRAAFLKLYKQLEPLLRYTQLSNHALARLRGSPWVTSRLLIDAAFYHVNSLLFRDGGFYARTGADEVASVPEVASLLDDWNPRNREAEEETDEAGSGDCSPVEKEECIPLSSGDEGHHGIEFSDVAPNHLDPAVLKEESMPVLKPCDDGDASQHVEIVHTPSPHHGSCQDYMSSSVGRSMCFTPDKSLKRRQSKWSCSSCKRRKRVAGKQVAQVMRPRCLLPFAWVADRALVEFRGPELEQVVLHTQHPPPNDWSGAIADRKMDKGISEWFFRIERTSYTNIICGVADAADVRNFPHAAMQCCHSMGNARALVLYNLQMRIGAKGHVPNDLICHPEEAEPQEGDIIIIRLDLCSFPGCLYFYSAHPLPGMDDCSRSFQSSHNSNRELNQNSNHHVPASTFHRETHRRCQSSSGRVGSTSTQSMDGYFADGARRKTSGFYTITDCIPTSGRESVQYEVTQLAVFRDLHTNTAWVPFIDLRDVDDSVVLLPHQYHLSSILPHRNAYTPPLAQTIQPTSETNTNNSSNKTPCPVPMGSSREVEVASSSGSPSAMQIESSSPIQPTAGGGEAVPPPTASQQRTSSLPHQDGREEHSSDTTESLADWISAELIDLPSVDEHVNASNQTEASNRIMTASTVLGCTRSADVLSELLCSMAQSSPSIPPITNSAAAIRTNFSRLAVCALVLSQPNPKAIISDLFALCKDTSGNQEDPLCLSNVSAGDDSKDIGRPSEPEARHTAQDKSIQTSYPSSIGSRRPEESKSSSMGAITTRHATCDHDQPLGITVSHIVCDHDESQPMSIRHSACDHDKSGIDGVSSHTCSICSSPASPHLSSVIAGRNPTITELPWRHNDGGERQRKRKRKRKDSSPTEETSTACEGRVPLLQPAEDPSDDVTLVDRAKQLASEAITTRRQHPSRHRPGARLQAAQTNSLHASGSASRRVASQRPKRRSVGEQRLSDFRDSSTSAERKSRPRRKKPL